MAAGRARMSVASRLQADLYCAVVVEGDNSRPIDWKGSQRTTLPAGRRGADSRGVGPGRGTSTFLHRTNDLFAERASFRQRCVDLGEKARKLFQTERGKCRRVTRFGH